jgi:uncharacterized protein
VCPNGVRQLSGFREVVMAEHPNVDVLRRGYEAFSSGDMASVRSFWTEDIVWHVKGMGKLAGDYHGPDEVFAFFGQLMEETAGTSRVDVHAILADDEHGAVLVTTHAERNGRSRASQAAQLYHLLDGKVRETWFANTDPAEDLSFWQ